MTAAAEAVACYQQLADASPSAYRPGHGASLRGFARICVQFDRRLPEALTAARTAVDIFAELTVDLPDRFATPAVEAIKTHADVLERLGRVAEANKMHADVLERLGRVAEANKMRTPIHVFVKGDR